MKRTTFRGKALAVLILLTAWGCANHSDSEVHQHKRDQVITLKP